MSDSPPRFAPPGSSSYSSNSLQVGDGTWDAQRNTFLLPNLQPLNLATTQYNGMGNRFRDLPQYHRLILGHAILGALVFLGIIPGAIIIARFYHRNPRLALRLHVWLQVLTYLLSTIVLILGWFAVGPHRSLTNPHHGIGVALYVLITVQFFAGVIIKRIEKNKDRQKIPLKLYLHQWVGRGIALLGFAQVPLGLTLYGSPKYLFILYAVFMAFLLVLYFILSYRNHGLMVMDDRGTYTSGSRTDITPRKEKHRGRWGLGALAALTAAGIGISKMRNRSRSRDRSRSRMSDSRVDDSRLDDSRLDDSRIDGEGSRYERRRHRHHDSHMSGTSWDDDEKYTEVTEKDHTWRNRVLGGAAGLGAFTLLKNMMGGKKNRDDESIDHRYPHHPLGGARNITRTDLSAAEEGRIPRTPTRPAAAMTGTPGSRRRDSIDSWEGTDMTPDHHRGPPRGMGMKEGIATLGFAGFLKSAFNKRKAEKEDRRVEEMRRTEMENERINRAHSRRYTGDGTPRRHRRRPSSLSDLSSHVPRAAGAQPPPSDIPLPPPHLHPDAPSNLHSESDRYSSRGPGLAAAAATGAALAAPPRDTSRRRSSGGVGPSRPDAASPPVSLKVKMHSDGRHVTLRRLDEAEAAAERESRRRERLQRRRRTSSLSSASGDDRWRRGADIPATPMGPPGSMPGSSAMYPPPPPGPPPHGDSGMMPMDLPPPPPIPGMSGLGGMASPGTGTVLSGPETEGSAYDSNRRRRRAQRAQANLARGGGSRVEFS